MINNGNVLAQANNMVHLLIGHTDHIKIANAYQRDGIIFITTPQHARRFILMFSDHGWAVTAKEGKINSSNMYIKVYYNKPQRLMSEADIAKHMS